MYLGLGQIPCLVVSSVAVVESMFKSHDATFSDRPQTYFRKVQYGDSAMRSLSSAGYGSYWRQVRRMCNTELFSPGTHASQEGVRREEIQNMLDVLVHECKRRKPIDLGDWLFGVSTNNMTRMLINKRYYGTGAEIPEKKEEFQGMVKSRTRAAGTFVISDFIPSLTFIAKLQGLPKRFRESHESAKAQMESVLDVEEHRKNAIARASVDIKSEYSPDFVDVLLKAPLDDGQPLADSDIKFLLTDLMIAGTETTGITVEWAMVELMLRPELRKQAQEEIDAVVGADPERFVQESDIQKLPFLVAILKETFRVHPVAPLNVMRSSYEPCEFAGYYLPAQTRLIVNQYAIHRDPSVYENPDKFEPRRFMENPEVNPLSGRDSYQLIPFGVGRRMCPASNLAFTMALLMLANLLHTFDWSFPDGVTADNFDVSEEFLGTVLRKKTPTILMAKPRSHVQ